MVTVELTPEADKQAERLPSVILERVRKLIRRLERWPVVSGVKALSGDLGRVVSPADRRLPHPVPRPGRADHRGEDRPSEGVL